MAVDSQNLPRERLEKRGAGLLSDAELVSILLGSGNKKHNVFELAKKVLSKIDELNGSLSVRELSEIDGIGSAKACLIVAALEFARRRIKPHGTKIKAPADIVPQLQHLADRAQEHFVCVTLNGAHEIIAQRVITIGLLNFCQVHPREVFSDAITDRAAAIIVCHNHPSGELTPSSEDRALTRRLLDAGKLLGINLLDHVIISRRGHYSFSENGDLV